MNSSDTRRAERFVKEKFEVVRKETADADNKVIGDYKYDRINNLPAAVVTLIKQANEINRKLAKLGYTMSVNRSGAYWDDPTKPSVHANFDEYHDTKLAEANKIAGHFGGTRIAKIDAVQQAMIKDIYAGKYASVADVLAALDAIKAPPPLVIK